MGFIPVYFAVLIENPFQVFSISSIVRRCTQNPALSREAGYQGLVLKHKLITV